MNYQTRNDRRLSTLLLAFSSACATVALTGCTNLATTASPTALSVSAVVAGQVNGGQSPISGSRIYLFLPGTSGYGSAATSLLTTANNANNTGANAVGYVTLDSNGNGYVRTTDKGNFQITGDFSCGSNTGAQVYALALGGNPGLSTANGAIDNSAIAMVAPVGTCSSIGNSFIVINEVTTAAFITAAQQFTVDATHIGTSSTNAQGLNNAIATVSDLVTLSNGTATAKTVSGTGTTPQAKLNLLGNILAGCINTSSPGSSNCTSLFSATKPTNGSTPTNTLTAMLSIANSPDLNIAAIYNTLGTSPAGTPFTPQTASQPNDYTLTITYTGGGISAPGAVAIDANGAPWLANSQSTQMGSAGGSDAIVGLTPRGTFLSGTSGYTAGIHGPQGLAFDLNGNLWSTNLSEGSAPDELIELKTADGSTPYIASNGLNSPFGVAVDSANQIWVANRYASNIVAYTTASNSGPLLTATSNGFSVPIDVAVDGTGSVFSTGAYSSSILKVNTTTGAVLSGSGAGYTGGGLNQPAGLAIDHNDYLFTLNVNSSISVLLGTNGTATPSSPTYAGINNSSFVAVDGLGNAWLPNCQSACNGSGNSPDQIIELGGVNSARPGRALNEVQQTGTSAGYQDPNLSAVATVALDGSGNLWVTNNTGASVTQFIGIAGPVVTPLAVAAKNNQLGVRP